MLLVMIIMAIMVIAVAKISDAAFSSHKKLRGESLVFHDLFWALDFMKHKVMNADTVTIDASWTGAQWKSSALVTDASAFVLYQPAGSTGVNFVFVPDITDKSNVETIFSAGESMSFTPTQSSKLVTLIIVGKKDTSGIGDYENFNETIVIKRRN